MENTDSFTVVERELGGGGGGVCCVLQRKLFQFIEPSLR